LEDSRQMAVICDYAAPDIFLCHCVLGVAEYEAPGPIRKWNDPHAPVDDRIQIADLLPD
jgi:hypothetical protein